MFRTVERAYLVLSLERTGSGLLCDALERTGRLGTPYELFSADVRPSASFQAHVDALVQETAKGGVFGAKVHRNQYCVLEQAGYVTSPLDLVPAHCRQHARVVLLTRADQRRQAISILLARGTGVWGLVDGEDAPQMTLPANPHWARLLDGSPETVRATLDEILETIVEEERGWSRCLADAGIEALRVTYEELAADYAGTVIRTARHVGELALDRGDVPPMRSRKQADETTEDLLRLWSGVPAERA